MSESEGNSPGENTVRLERAEIVAERLQGYQDWQETLKKQVADGKITDKRKEEMISRALVARDLLVERSRQQGLRDPLTQLANRRYFESRFDRMVKTGKPIGLLILDLDNFKKVNDEHGHAAGDDVLIQVSMMLTSLIREYRIDFAGERDTVARIGGEEFAILLEDIGTNDKLLNIAERIRTAFGDENPLEVTTPSAVESIPITFSIGGGIYRHGNRKQFQDKVDQHGLYEAKHQGRNRTIILPDEGVHV